MIEKIQQPDDTYKWYVLYVSHNREFWIRDKICGIFANEQSVKQILIPTTQKVIIKKNEKKVKLDIIYPSYIFILASLNDDVIQKIHNIENVYHFLGFHKSDEDTLPDCLSVEELKKLEKNSDMKQNKALSHSGLKVNDYVCIINGIFRNLKGYVKELRNSMVILELEEVLNRKDLAVTISIDEIEKMN